MKVAFQTFSLSGMGGGYEDFCQVMLWRGVGYLAEVQPPVEMWANAKSYANVYGVLSTEGDDLKRLEKAIIHEGEDCTGAMHQCVMGHLAYIHKNGIDVWRDHMGQHRDPNDINETFEWEGSL